MKFTYDQEADAFYARFATDGTPVVETREVAPNANIDLDESGDLVDLEVLHVHLREQRHADHE